MRSILAVPCTPDRLKEALRSGASVVVVDLTIAAGGIEERLAHVAAWLSGPRETAGRPALYVRLHEVRSEAIDRDLTALFTNPPEGVLLSGCRSGADVQHASTKLAVIEAESSLPDGRIRILALAGSSAGAVLSMAGFAGASRRLAGLVWEPDALARDLNLPPARSGRPESAPLSQARGLVVLAAKAAGVPAFIAGSETASEAFDETCRRARDNGFSGMLVHEAEAVRHIEAAWAPD